MAESNTHAATLRIVVDGARGVGKSTVVSQLAATNNTTVEVASDGAGTPRLEWVCYTAGLFEGHPLRLEVAAIAEALGEAPRRALLGLADVFILIAEATPDGVGWARDRVSALASEVDEPAWVVFAHKQDRTGALQVPSFTAELAVAGEAAVVATSAEGTGIRYGFAMAVRAGLLRRKARGTGRHEGDTASGLDGLLALLDGTGATEVAPGPEAVDIEPVPEPGPLSPAVDAEPEPEPIALEPVPEPEPVAVEAVVEPVVEPADELVAEPVVELVAEPVVEPVAETVVELVAEPAVEPVAEPAVEPVVELIAEPAVEAAPEPATAAVAVEPVTIGAELVAVEAVPEPELAVVEVTPVEVMPEPIVTDAAQASEDLLAADHAEPVEPIPAAEPVLDETPSHDSSAPHAVAVAAEPDVPSPAPSADAPSNTPLPVAPVVTLHRPPARPATSTTRARQSRRGSRAVAAALATVAALVLTVLLTTADERPVSTTGQQPAIPSSQYPGR